MEPEPAPTASSVLNEVAAHQNDNDDSDISTLKDNEEENEDKEQKIAAAIGAELWFPSCKPWWKRPSARSSTTRLRI